MDLDKQDNLLLMTLQRSIRHDGGTPSLFLLSLATATKRKLWSKLGMDFLTFITNPVEKGGIGITKDNLMLYLELKHMYEDKDTDIKQQMIDMRQAVMLELGKEGEVGNPTPVQDKTTGKFSNRIDDNINNTVRQSPTGTSKHAGLRRLQKEVNKAKGTPKFEQVSQLQEMVITGQKSVNSALVELGVRKKMVQMPIGDIDKLIAVIEKYFDKDEVKKLL